MDSKQYLLDQINKCKRKMNLAKFIDSGILYAAAGGIFGMICELLSLFVPFYYADLAAVLCFAAGLITGICYALYMRVNVKQAASRLDSFGLKERMLTACENIDAEDEFAKLQRQDAILHYDRIREQIKIPLLPDKRHILAFIISAAVVTGMSFIPSPVREQAKLHHLVQKEAEKEKEELEELLDVLESVDMESLTEEQRAKLQELLDTMELSQEELAGADSWESLSAAMQKLDYKYGQAAQSLEQLAGQVENPEAAGIASAEGFAKAAAEQNGQQTASSGTPRGSSGENDGQGGDNGSGGENGQSGENGSGEGGQSGGSGSGQGGDNGSGNGDGQDGENGSGNGDGQDGENGSGNGGGEGGDNGSGNGGGQDGNNGSGGGNGSGSGRGTGSSDAAHDYVSIPNATADDPSLTGNKNGDQDSDYYRGQNGLAWEGEHVDYSSVIGEYTESAYEGLANGRYPSGMESVIRDYFESLNK